MTLPRERRLIELEDELRVYHGSKAIMDSKTMVYFVEADHPGRPIKIGSSATPRSRMAEMQVSSPVPLTLLHACIGGAARERELHAEFTYERIRGEWFKPSRTLLSFILLSKRATASIARPEIVGIIDRIARTATCPASTRAAIIELESLVPTCPIVEPGQTRGPTEIGWEVRDVTDRHRIIIDMILDDA